MFRYWHRTITVIMVLISIEHLSRESTRELVQVRVWVWLRFPAEAQTLAALDMSFQSHFPVLAHQL